MYDFLFIQETQNKNSFLTTIMIFIDHFITIVFN